eukprot:6214364-Pleurochrysis_carterae.AAC.8
MRLLWRRVEVYISSIVRASCCVRRPLSSNCSTSRQNHGAHLVSLILVHYQSSAEMAPPYRGIPKQARGCPGRGGVYASLAAAAPPRRSVARAK